MKASDWKVLTGMIVDWSGSTALHEEPKLGRLSAERAERIRETIKQPFDELLHQTLRESGGHYVHTTGDGACCVFESAQQGVLAALVMQHRLDQRAIPVPGGILKARIGLHTEDTPADAAQRQYIHQAGNYAARAQSLARPAVQGGVVVTAKTHALCGHDIAPVTFTDLGLHQGKKGERPRQFFSAHCPPTELRRLSAEWKRDAAIRPIEFTVGTRVNRYRLTAEIKSGKDVILWKAQWTDGLGGTREVVLKFLLPDLDRTRAQREALEDWFLEEARAFLEPIEGVVRAFDADLWLPPRSSRSIPYFVMDWVEGSKPLDEVLHGRDAPTIVQALCDICDGVTSLHRRRRLHLDLKPDNILVIQDGEKLHFRLIDLGTSQRYNPTRCGDPRRFGQGTLRYMAPEQINPKLGGPTPRTDVHALGVILFELLTGESPHEKYDTDEQLQRRIVKGPRREVSKVSPDLDVDLAKIVETAMSIDPQERFAFPTQFAHSLADWQKKHAPDRPPSDPAITITNTFDRTVIGPVGGDVHFH